MKLAVVGSINMDMTVTAERIPLKGETLRGDSLHYIPGGKGANQAVAMAKLGAKVEMFGCVGDDANGTRLLENFKKVGVETGHIKVLEGVPTGIAMITVGENDNTIIVVPGANGKVDRDYIDRIKEELKTFDMVVLQQEIPLDTVYYVVDFCYDNQIPVVLNPAPASNVPLEVIEKVTYVTPNEHEAVLIFWRGVFYRGLVKRVSGKTDHHTGLQRCDYLFEEWRNLECTGEKSECGRYDRGRRYVKRCICPAESKRSGYGDSTSVCECGSQLIHRKIRGTERNADGTGSRRRIGKTGRKSMKRQGILNSDISRVLSYMGHTDTICIGDYGLPIPDETERIDLAVKIRTAVFYGCVGRSRGRYESREDHTGRGDETSESGDTPSDRTIFCKV